MLGVGASLLLWVGKLALTSLLGIAVELLLALHLVLLLLGLLHLSASHGLGGHRH